MRYRKQVEEMQRAFNKTIIKLQNTSRMAEEQFSDQRQTDSIQSLQVQLENVTSSSSICQSRESTAARCLTDRSRYSAVVCFSGVLLGLLICVNYWSDIREVLLVVHRDPAVSTEMNCCPEDAETSDTAVALVPPHA
ncbi:hypothetical protein QQF64_014246 [Cirrhinus molitorella]|uniref:Uncharacterized protein n=1 Tax=Cirrhinus molitorella TaxID=172907 RepID=A0ABR3NS89_9TELE